MKNNKELIIAMLDAEQQMVEAVNVIMQNNGLPCFLMETIVDRVHRQLLDGKAAEIQAAKARITGEGEKQCK